MKPPASSGASAPRVRVRDDMLMRCRLLIDGRPYFVIVTVADATGRSAERASITLNVIRVTLDVQERATHRFEFEVNATLTASVCEDIRVRSVRTGGHGTKVLGCAFTAISPETLATVSGLLGRIDRQDDAPSVSVREVLGITGDVDGDSPGRSAQRRRSQAPKHTVFGRTRRRSEAPT